MGFEKAILARPVGGVHLLKVAKVCPCDAPGAEERPLELGLDRRHAFVHLHSLIRGSAVPLATGRKHGGKAQVHLRPFKLTNLTKHSCGPRYSFTYYKNSNFSFPPASNCPQWLCAASRGILGVKVGKLTGSVGTRVGPFIVLSVLVLGTRRGETRTLAFALTLGFFFVRPVAFTLRALMRHDFFGLAIFTLRDLSAGAIE